MREGCGLEPYAILPAGSKALGRNVHCMVSSKVLRVLKHVKSKQCNNNMHTHNVIIIIIIFC
jgi:hypothetical protein